MKTPRSLVAMFASILVPAIGLSTASADEQVPFRGAYTSAITFTSPYTATLVGKGIATHLGQAGNHGDLSIVGPASCAGGFAVENEDMLTAANGDTVTIRITQESCPIGPGVYLGAGTYVVRGGTGRFAGAQGGGEFSGLGDFGAGTVNCTLTGTISSPGL